MTDRELFKMALDALEEAKENVMDWGSYASEYFKTKHGLAQDILAIENISEALRARLAQPVQNDEKGKPMTYWGGLAQPEPEELARLEQAMIEAWKPIPQREWQGLTDKEIENCFEMSMFGTCRAIEAKLKEKNT